MSPTELQYAPAPASLICDKTAAGVRLLIPFPRRIKILTTIWVCCGLVFAWLMGALAAKGIATLFGGVAVLVGIALLAAATIAILVTLAMGLLRRQPILVEADDQFLSVGSPPHQRRWPREKVRDVRVGRWVFPRYGVLEIEIGYDSALRVAIYDRVDLARGVDELRTALGLVASGK